MNWQDWGAIGELVGAVATVATLAYLAIQIRLNSAHLEEGTRASYLHQVDQTVEAFSRHRHLLLQPGVAELFERGLDSYDELSAADRTRFRAVTEEYFYAYNALFERERRGAYDFNSSRTTLPLDAILSRPGGRQWWAERGPSFPPKFVEDLESRFPDLLGPNAEKE
jgi:hypothetical protein